MLPTLLRIHKAITARLMSESEKLGIGGEWEAKSMSSVSEPYSNLDVKRERARALQEMLYMQTVLGAPFCDATLNIQGKVLKFHWCVLVGCPYFEALYNFNTSINKSTSYELQLDFGDAEAMENTIRFLYTGEVSVNQDTVEHYLKIADYMQCTQLTSHCASYLETIRLSTTNCVEVSANID